MAPAHRDRDVVIPSADAIRPGGLDEASLYWLASIAARVSGACALEIGTARGVSTYAIAANMPNAQVYTVDLPAGAVTVHPPGRNDHAVALPAGERYWAGTAVEPRIVQILGDSATVDLGLLAGKCELIFIDGAHSAEYVRSDTERAFELVATRAAILWDDYWQFAPDVVAYLDRRQDLDLFRLPSSRLVVWMSPQLKAELLAD
ncbi:MAG: class I SAM-dependent methyltransferase [Candidatus Dormibacteria bacterium]